MNNDELENLPDDQRVDRLAGLRNFLTAEPTKPRNLTLDQYLALTIPERAAYDEERIDYLGTDVIIPTPHLKAAKDTMRALRLTNRGKKWGRSGMLLSGRARLGKTSTALHIAKYVYDDYGLKHPDHLTNGDIPVVFVNIPSSPNGRSMVKQCANFYGIPYGKSDTLDFLKGEILPLLNNHNTQLVIFDEIHNLSKKRLGDLDTIALLKEFSNSSNATFVYAGINIHKGGLLSGEEGEQIAGRFRARVLTNYGYGNPAQRAVWRGLVRGLASELRLLGDSPEEIAKHSLYLHQRTRGAIGPLSQLLFTAAQLTIAGGEQSGNEQLTLEMLDSIQLDLLTEQATGGYRHGENFDVAVDDLAGVEDEMENDYAA